MKRVDRIKNSKSSLPGTLKRENAYAASVPRNTARKVEPKPMIIEFIIRPGVFDSPAMTNPRSRAIWSQRLVASGRLAIYSGVWRERKVKRLQKPSTVGVVNTLGGYAIESVGLF